MNVFDLAEQLVDSYCELRPTEATVWGVVGFDDSWGDWSPAGWDAVMTVMRSARSDLDALPDSDDAWELIGRRVFLDFIDSWIGRLEDHDHLRDLNNIASPVQDLRSAFEVPPKVTVGDWQAIVSRLAASDEPVDGYIECLELGIQSELTVARRQVEACIRQLEVNGSDQSPFIQLISEFDAAAIDNPELRTSLTESVAVARKASDRLRMYLEDVYLHSAIEADAVGRDRYARLLQPYLGATVDLDETYQWGWAEIGRLWDRAEHLAIEIEPGASVARAITILKTDPDRAAHSPAEFVAAMKERQQRALADLAGVHFDVPEEIRFVDVQLAPSGGALGAHYHGPSEDFSRPGSVWYSIGDNTVIPLYSEVSTAYHEGFPGHHLQTGIQVGLKDRLTRLHRTLAWRAGYGEGWALYAETLMDELGYFELPEYELGYVASQLLRACRIVIDIGMHLDLRIDSEIVAGTHWTFEKAVALLKSHAFLAEDYARSEVTRYLGWPGQAISYKIGEQTILDLRAQRSSLPNFDLKAFHRDVLGSGPVGLDHLRDIVLASR